jgi:signal transduction histidine kinase
MNASMSTLVIGADGRVIAAGGHLSDALADRLLEDCAELPEAVRRAGAALVARLRAPGQRPHIDIVAAAGAETVVLVAIEAVAIRRTPTDLRLLLKSKLAALSRQADEAGVHLQIDVADEVPALVALDADKIAWAVSTLVGNALRYVPPSRWLGISMIGVSVTCPAGASELTVDVTDTGRGIPPADAARLLDRTAGTQGRGLALLLIRDIVAAHGGHMAVISSTEAARHGTTFRLTLPVR